MDNEIIEQIKKTKKASHSLALFTDAQRNLVLQAIAAKLRDSCQRILAENAKDLGQIAPDNPMHDRLSLNEARISAIASDIESVIKLDSPLGNTIERRVCANGLVLTKVTVPLGVVAVIYESRPNVTIDVFSLCFKTGNACVLKGGKEAEHSNKVLTEIIHQVLLDHGVDPWVLSLLPATRVSTQVLLSATGLIDVCIPRGSQSLISFVRENAKIPVIETGAGIVSAYFDLSGDLEKGRLIINNAKTRRVSVCNALDCLVVHHQRLADLFRLVEPLISNHVEIFGDPMSYQALAASYPAALLHHAAPEDFGREFLSHKLSIKTVVSVEESVVHIMRHTSGHSEAIIAEDQQAITYFLTRIDTAVIYVNASTAFTDGGQFGLGSEIGISTQKLHARGPMGLVALTSYQWIVYGDGHIRS